jgi:hypothetical protein
MIDYEYNRLYCVEAGMIPIAQTASGRIHSVILAPGTAYVVMQVADAFLEAFVSDE